jgi:hypothetical protein
MRQKSVLEATQTKVTQSPKPKPKVTATNLMKRLKGDLVWRLGDYFLKRVWKSAAQVHRTRWGV